MKAREGPWVSATGKQWTWFHTTLQGDSDVMLLF